MKILLLCDHYPLPPRIINMKNSIQKLIPNTHIDIFAWNRNNAEVVDADVITLNMDIGYGKQIKKLLHIRKVLKFIKKIIKNGEYDVLQGIDFEMAFLASLVKGKAKLIYEVYDIKFFSRKILGWGRENVEKYFIQRSVDGMILASPYFENYYEMILKRMPQMIVINNKPLFHKNFYHDSGFMELYHNELTNKTVVSFIGLLRYPEILKNLMSVLSGKGNFVLLLAGDGPSRKELEHHAKEIKMNNVIFTGRYQSSDLKSIYERTDIVWAAYPNDDKNVKYAVSNKFFEAQVFKKKIIVSEHTHLGDSVNQKGIGQCVNPYSIENIDSVLNSVMSMDYQISSKTNIFWQDEEKQIEFLYKNLLKDKRTVGDSK